MKKYIISLLCLLVCFIAYSQTYDATKATVSNKPYGPAQAVPTDSRTYFYDAPNFKWRPYQNTTEVLTYLNLAKYRTGQFPIVVNFGGFLNAGVITGGVNELYYFKNGQADSNLVQMIVSSGACVGCLLAANNLSDLANVVTARSNLGLGAMSLLTSTASGDLTGTWPAITVAKFNGQAPSYYLNYNNLFNTPTIPAQLNPTCVGCTITGSYPNLTWTVSGGSGFNTAGVDLIALSSSTVGLDTQNYRKMDTLYGVNDSTINYKLNGIVYSVQIKGGHGAGGGAGTGTVTSVSVVTANGVSGSVANPTSAAAITLTLGAITPSTVNGLTLTALSTGFTIQGGTTSKTLTVPLDATVSGTNTGDVTLAGETYITRSGQVLTLGAVNLSGTQATGTLAAARFGALTGDVTNSAGSYATTISNSAVTYAKIQNVTSGAFLGRYTAGSGVVQEMTFGSGLSLNTSTGVLSAGVVLGGTVPNIAYATSTGIYTVTGIYNDSANNRMNFTTKGAYFVNGLSSVSITSAGVFQNSGSVYPLNPQSVLSQTYLILNDNQFSANKQTYFFDSLGGVGVHQAGYSPAIFTIGAGNYNGSGQKPALLFEDLSGLARLTTVAVKGTMEYEHGYIMFTDSLNPGGVFRDTLAGRAWARSVFATIGSGGSGTPDTIRLIQKGNGINALYTSAAGDTLYQKGFLSTTTIGVTRNSDSSLSWNSLLTFTNSISLSGATVQLVGDAASPGNYYLYSTNGSGTRGWNVYSSLPVATLSVNGLFSSSEKARLDSSIRIINAGSGNDSVLYASTGLDTLYAKRFQFVAGTGISSIDRTGSTQQLNKYTVNANIASSSVFGVVKVDGTTITAAGGVLSAVSSTASSGQYTPTFTNSTNSGSFIADTTYYTVIGNQVTVWGTVYMTATSANTATAFYISLPIPAGAVFDLHHLHGLLNENKTYNGSGHTGQNSCGGITGSTFGGNRAIVEFYSSDNQSNSYKFSFSYFVDNS